MSVLKFDTPYKDRRMRTDKWSDLETMPGNIEKKTVLSLFCTDLSNWMHSSTVSWNATIRWPHEIKKTILLNDQRFQRINKHQCQVTHWWMNECGKFSTFNNQASKVFVGNKISVKLISSLLTECWGLPADLCSSSEIRTSPQSAIYSKNDCGTVELSQEWLF